MRKLRFAALGCGFWARFQLAAWREVGGVELVALYNRTRGKAESLAAEFGASAVYDVAEALLAAEKLDFVDIITDVNTHSHFVELAARHGVPAICQKPMAPDLVTAERMVKVCRDAGVPFMVHENWRWQHPIRQLKKALLESGAGKPFRAHILYANSFPVFENQPGLRNLEQFILTDMGSHILDTARFLFGDARRLYCQANRVNPGIRGEDVATVMMEMGDDVTVTCALSYAGRVEHDRFPETYVFVECEDGSVELGPDYWIKITDRNGTRAERHPPPHYHWADPSYDLVHSSIVPCNADLLHSLRTGEPAETSGEDNLKTMRLVFGAYESAATGKAIAL
ncbi:MAG: Gfo/Idh/MocA family oxidoreductase [Armatimonadota bacterium]|nr:Gfo/Idh/MocA family oxidoreductase [Armatimonadota bacterium]